MNSVYNLPNWVGQQQAQSYLPRPLQPWLFDSGSMTKRLRKFAKQALDVQLLEQCWGHPTVSESLYLQCGAKHQVLIREVYLRCDNAIVMFGRTVFPYAFFQGRGRKWLALLDTRPIGDLLFKEASLKRTRLYFSQLDNSHLEFHLATQGYNTSETRLWARRSQFYIYDQPLLVTEVVFSENIFS